MKTYIMKKIFCFYLFFMTSYFLSANDKYPRYLNIDVLHYEFALVLNDSTDNIEGRTSILIDFKDKADSVVFDLKGFDGDGKGMKVSSVFLNGEAIDWKQGEEKLLIVFNNIVNRNDTCEFVIEYRGIPADGLIISKNKFGNRTFFADHWPNRAHNYLPCIDHPYDKASVDFVITAPDRYKVVASGTMIEESDLVGPDKLTHWSEIVPLATKVMTFGAAEFAVQLSANVRNITVWSWVYPENRVEGFYDYSIAYRPLEFYSSLVGEYPYEKLANVQSKTIWGGLENAGTIFYSENSVTGTGRAEGLIAHEIAHQWFGDCVTEADWYHVWLSEGFATYLTSLYFENVQGRDRLESDMASARTRVLRYYDRNPRPVIDTTVTNLMALLNANSYQKGAWFLHMLRNDLGNEVFTKGLRLYYQRFYNSNALTKDFMNIMEEVSAKNLDKFFRQWLYRAGQPELSIRQESGRKKGTTEIIIEQKQPELFEFKLQLLIKDKSGEMVENVSVKERITKLVVLSENVSEIVPDPFINLLFR